MTANKVRALRKAPLHSSVILTLSATSPVRRPYFYTIHFIGELLHE